MKMLLLNHFYLNGNKGVCVEANPEAIADLERVRSRDVIICGGCGGIEDEGKSLNFYIMKDHPAINTFSKDAVAFWEEKGFKCEDIIKVPMFTLNTILNKHFDTASEFVFIDVEGYEYNILKDLDFD